MIFFIADLFFLERQRKNKTKINYCINNVTYIISNISFNLIITLYTVMLSLTPCQGKIIPSNSTWKFLLWVSLLSCKSVTKKLLPNPNSTTIKHIFKVKNRCSITNLFMSRKRAQSKYSHYYLLPDSAWINYRNLISIIRKEIPEGKFYWQSVCPQRKTAQRITHRKVSGTEESMLSSNVRKLI